MTDALASEASVAPEIQTQAPEPQAPEPADHTPAPERDTPQKPTTLREAISKARQTVKEQLDAPETADRARDEHGRFKASEGQETPKAAIEAKPNTPDKPNSVIDKPNSVLPTDAPARFSPDAKAAWGATPDPVKAEINRAMTELQNGLTQYQQRFEPLKPYIQLAEQSGTTIEGALENYRALAMERQQNPAGFMAKMLHEMGSSPQEYAAHVLGQPVDQQAGQQNDYIRTLQAELSQLKEQIGTLSTDYRTRTQQEEARQFDAAWSEFSSTHPRANDLIDDMTKLIESGMATDAEDAYIKADRLNPAPHVAPPPASTPQPRKPSPQISGAPSGSNPVRKPSQSRTVSESIRWARSQAGL